MALIPQSSPVQHVIEKLADGIGWPRSRPPRVVVGDRWSIVDRVALAASESDIEALAPGQGTLVVLCTPPSSQLVRSGRRHTDPILEQGDFASWVRERHVVVDASECLAGGNGGFDSLFAEALGYTGGTVAVPVDSDMQKLVGFVPPENLIEVRRAVFEAGAGSIGAYSECSWSVPGIGTFKGNEGADPAVGEVGVFEVVDELRFETVFPSWRRNEVCSAYLNAHPYEEPAYDVLALANPAKTGMGRIYQSSVDHSLLESRLAGRFGAPVIRGGESQGHSEGFGGAETVVTSTSVGPLMPSIVNGSTSRAPQYVVCCSARGSEEVLLAQKGATVYRVERLRVGSVLLDGMANVVERATGLPGDIRTEISFPTGGITADGA